MNDTRQSIKSIFIFSMLFMLGSNCFSQAIIHGTILDHESRKEIEFAHLSITNSVFGTSTDPAGKFLLKVEREHTKEKIKISCIGYSNKFLSIDSLTRLSKSEIIIYLEPSTQSLNEVVVKATRIEPGDLLKQAIEAIPKNYLQQPFNMEFYTKTSVSDSSSNVLYRLESILLSYRNGYKPKAMDITKVLQKREIGKSPLATYRFRKESQDHFPYWAGMDISLVDQIGAGAGSGYTIFNPSLFKKLKFAYAGISIFDTDTLCAIEYSTRKKDVKSASEEVDGQYNGIIYIAVNNLAIIRHSLKIGNKFFDIIYRKHGIHYFPYAIKSKYPAYPDKHYLVSLEVYLKVIRTENIEVIEHKPENWFPDGVPFREEYWKENYPKAKN